MNISGIGSIRHLRTIVLAAKPDGITALLLPSSLFIDDDAVTVSCLELRMRITEASTPFPTAEGSTNPSKVPSRHHTVCREKQASSLPCATALDRHGLLDIGLQYNRRLE
jgi:hypothetical protein